MKKFLKLTIAFTFLFVISFNGVKAQETTTPEVEEEVSKLITTAPDPKIKGNNNSLTLTWEAVENANSYVVERSTNSKKGFKKVKTLSDTTFKDTKLTYGTTYYYKVTAKGSENSKKSVVVSKKVVPNKVTNVKLKQGSTKITVSWDKTSNTGYYVFRSTDGKKWEKITTIKKNSTVSYTNKKLKSNKLYYYRVQAYQKVGTKYVTGSKSDVISIKTAPAAPTVKISSADIDEIKYTLSLVSGAKYYQFYSYDEKTKKWEYEYEITSEEFRDKKFISNYWVEKPYHTYKFKFRACSDIVCGSYTEVSGQGKLRKTTIYSLRGEKKAVNISFETIYGANGYEIYRATSKNGKYTKIKTIKESETFEGDYKDTKVSTNKTYYYKVRSFAKIGKKTYYSSYSSIRSVKTGSNAGVNSAYEDAKVISKEGYFSKQLLINILVESCGYKESDATKGVEKLKLDYKANALKLAKQMLQYSYGMSENGLRKVLEEYEFTESEINYALSKINFDWHQALVDAILEDTEYGYSKQNFIDEFCDETYGYEEEEVLAVIEELGVNFNAQALIRLQRHLEYSDYITEEDAREMLDNCGFEEEEIDYAIENIDYDWHKAVIDSIKTDYNRLEWYTDPDTNLSYQNGYSRAYVISVLSANGYNYSVEDINEALDELEIDFAQKASYSLYKYLDAHYIDATPNYMRNYLKDALFTDEEIEYAFNNYGYWNNLGDENVLSYRSQNDNAVSRVHIRSYLESVGYEDENVEYIMNHISASDWQTMVVAFTEKYVYDCNSNDNGLSESLLRGALEDYEFTKEEIDYAMLNAAVNFNEQAHISAFEIIENGSYSEKMVIQNLLLKGYTEEQAAYGASYVNYQEECVEYINTNIIPNEITKTLDELKQEMTEYGFKEDEIEYGIETTNLESYL